MTKSRVLLLADVLDTTADFQMRAREAAVELRRLHEVNQELLEALKTVMGDVNHGQHMTWEQRCKQARAAINKATGEQA